jgi:hypothetical protein
MLHKRWVICSCTREEHLTADQEIEGSNLASFSSVCGKMEEKSNALWLKRYIMLIFFAQKNQNRQLLHQDTI